MRRVLGIDLGTTNSVCAYLFKGEPKVVAVRNRDSTGSVLGVGRRGELLVGETARSRRAVDPENFVFSVKRFVGRWFAAPEVQEVLARLRLPYRVEEGPDGEVSIVFHGRSYTPTQLSSLILGRLKADAEAAAGVEFPRAVITVPAYFTQRQRAATREAGRLAGFDVLRVLDEPTAAALVYNHDREDDSDQTVLVFDLGGGTFDISVLEMVGGLVNVLNIEGDNLLGGDDFDNALVGWLLDRVRAEEGVDLSADRKAVLELTAAAEKAKVELSEALEAYVCLAAIGEARVDIDITVTREQFEELIRDRVDTAIALVGKALDNARLAADRIDEVLLVGGSTSIPYVQHRLEELFGTEKVRRHVHPMKSVALGAAIQGAYVPAVDCPGCAAENPVGADGCASCGTALQPPSKVACPACFRYCDEGTQFCWTCGADLAGGGATVVVPRSSTCPTCGRPVAEAGAACGRCGDEKAGWLLCTCGHLNPPGVQECGNPACDRFRAEPLQVTPLDLGIELDDGRMSVVLPKNTQVPTVEPAPRDFVTTKADEPRMEIVVYEGARPVAADNELCGYLTVSLPPGLPKGTPVVVSFGLDTSRMITVRVMVKGIEREARLKHGSDERLDPELLRRVEEQRRKVESFVGRWARELTDKELGQFEEETARLERVLNGEADRAEAEDAIERSTQSIELATDVRGKDAFLSAVQRAIGKYIGRDQADTLARFSVQIDQERERGDWLRADMHATEARAYLDRLGPDMLALAYCRTFAAQGALSPRLSMSVQDVARRYDEAFDRRDEDGKAQAQRDMAHLWRTGVRPEVEGRPEERHGPQRPGAR